MLSKWLAAGLALALSACGASEPRCVRGTARSCECAQGQQEVSACQSDGTWAYCSCQPARIDYEDRVPRLRSAQQLDLLLVVDNSNSMAEWQATFMAQASQLVDRLTNPPCVSRSIAGGGAPHACREGNEDDLRQFAPIVDLHVGVVSSDLGTQGVEVAGCDEPSNGDDGLLNPIRNGVAMQAHLPWAPRRSGATAAPEGFRPSTCESDPQQFPAFIKYCSNSADWSCETPGRNASTRNAGVFADWFECNAGLYVNGCRLGQPLEAIWRALVQKDARDIPGNISPNAGFIRSDALLAIVVLSDKDDGSTRDCAHDEGFSATRTEQCADASTVYNVSSADWAHPSDLDARFSLYTPGDRRDPTWHLDRYFNTTSLGGNTYYRWNKDLLSLKPGHPERVIFAAITGVPLAVPMRDEQIDWDALLGAPSERGPDVFNRRDSSTAVAGTQGAAGPYSMRAANMDPRCSHVVPACRRAGTTYDPAQPCADAQEMAFPARRIVEIARRFDEWPACAGQPCRNGFVASICDTSYRDAIGAIALRVGRNARTECLDRTPVVRFDTSRRRTVRCVLRERQPPGVTRCDWTQGRSVPRAVEARVDDTMSTVCEVQQVATDFTTGAPVSNEPGWYFDTRPNYAENACPYRVSFNGAASPEHFLYCF
jgi:hypothetical protein